MLHAAMAFPVNMRPARLSVKAPRAPQLMGKLTKLTVYPKAFAHAMQLTTAVARLVLSIGDLVDQIVDARKHGTQRPNSGTNAVQDLGRDKTLC